MKNSHALRRYAFDGLEDQCARAVAMCPRCNELQPPKNTKILSPIYTERCLQHVTFDFTTIESYYDGK
jgi:hypothetical protein